MPILSNKHADRLRRIVHSGFSGGLNLSVPAESLASNELRVARNVEFDNATGGLRVRGGLVKFCDFDGDVRDMVPIPGKYSFLVRLKDNRLYYFNSNLLWHVGQVNGDGAMSAAMWDKPGQMLVATGAKLQIFDESVNFNGSVQTIDAAPDECRSVFVKNGRAGVVDGPDTLRFSWVGDPYKWENNPDDESTGQFLELGYKDGSDIAAVCHLSTDMIFFKSPNEDARMGEILRLTGDFPNWNVVSVAHNTGTFHERSALTIGNDIYYLTPDGLGTLSTVATYGDVKANWPDRKVSNILAPKIDGTCRMINLASAGQIWIFPRYKENVNDDVWIYDYIRGMWTTFQFPGQPECAVDFGDIVFVVIGRVLYQFNPYFSYDDFDNRKAVIEARIRPGNIINGRQSMMKGALATFLSQPTCSAYLGVNGWKMPLVDSGAPEYVYSDEHVACLDTVPLVASGGSLMSARRMGIVRGWELSPEVVVIGGGFSLVTLGFETAEV